MKRTVLVAVALVAILAGGMTLSFAEDTQPKAPAAAQPAKKAKKRHHKKAEGCKPDGSCCGSAACTQAESGKSGAGAATGGCPCSKHKQQPAS